MQLWPKDIITKTVTAGPAITLEDGNPAITEVTVKSSRSLTWRGIPLPSQTRTLRPEVEAEVSFDLPVCDMAGMRDGKGRPIILSPGDVTHYYHLTLKFYEPDAFTPFEIREIGPFTVLTDSPDIIDLDEIVSLDYDPQTGLAISVPDQWTNQILEIKTQFAAAISETNQEIARVDAAKQDNLNRSILTNLASTTAATDTGGNLTPGVTGVLPMSHGGTGKTTRHEAIAALLDSRTVTAADNSTGEIFDTGDNLAIPLPVTVVAPAASTTQTVAGTRALRVQLKTLIDNIAALFAGKQDNLPTGATAGQYLKHDLSFGNLTASDIPNLDAAKITTGTLDPARIPNLDAAKVTTGAFDPARIPNLAPSKITQDASNRFVTDADKTAWNGMVPASTKGAADGVATLDSSGRVPAAQLPSFVDDVIEYATRNSFPATGEQGKIYVATDANTTFRWTGTTYVALAKGSGVVPISEGGTGAITAAAALTALGAAAASHGLHVPAAGTAGQFLKHDNTWGQVPATSITQDASNRFVTDAEKTAWNGKPDKAYVDSAIAGGAPTAGLAASATKLETARSLKVKLDSTAAITFDGTAAQDSIPVTGVLPVANGGTGGGTLAAAFKSLSPINKGTAMGYFVGFDQDWLNPGHVSAANLKTQLGVPTPTRQTQWDNNLDAVIQLADHLNMEADKVQRIRDRSWAVRDDVIYITEQ
jgi:hypothetical protein